MIILFIFRLNVIKYASKCITFSEKQDIVKRRE